MSGDGTTGEAPAPWLSVLVPAYNVASFVGSTLDSVLCDRDAGFEVVVVDDGSTDDTRGRVERIAATDRRVRVIGDGVNRGASHARNGLLDEARGRYVWFLDADDRLLPGALDALRGAIADGPDVVLCDFRVTGRLRPWSTSRSTFDGHAEGHDAGALLAGALRAGQLHVWSKIARRALWQGVRFPARPRFEDITPSLALLARAGSWRHVRQPWIAYRQRPGSLMRTLGVDDLRAYAAALGEVRGIVGAGGDAPALAAAVGAFLLRGHASIARRLVAMGVAADDPVARDCAQRFRNDFPDRAQGALGEARRRRGRWHARRLTRALDAAGWRGG